MIEYNITFRKIGGQTGGLTVWRDDVPPRVGDLIDHSGKKWRVIEVRHHFLVERNPQAHLIFITAEET